MSRTLNVPVFRENGASSPVSLPNSVAFIWELGFDIRPYNLTQFLLTGWIYLQGTEPFYVFSQQAIVSKGDTVTLVFTAPPRSPEDLPPDSYAGVSVGISNLIGIEPVPNTMTVVFCPPTTLGNVIQVLNCAISPDWIIGARNIVIVDPDTNVSRT